MTGRTHAAGGIIAGMAISHYLFTSNQCQSLLFAGYLVGAALVGSLLPDLDSEKAVISKVLWPIAILYKMIKKAMRMFKVKGMEHRGVFHSLTVPAVLSLIGCLLYTAWDWTMYISIGVVSGYLSHLFLDMLNPMGISLFAPFFKPKIKLLPKCIAIKTGGVAESIIFGFLSIFLCICGFMCVTQFCHLR